MYQFGGGPGGNHQPVQHYQAGHPNYVQFPSFQPAQGYGHSQNLPVQQQMYQAPPQTSQAPVPPTPNFSRNQQGQTHHFQGHGANRQYSTSGASYSSKAQHMHQSPRGYASGAAAGTNQYTNPLAHYVTPPNQPIPHISQRQVSQGSPDAYANKSSESCYNCGAPDHWAQDCQEPRRAVPAGQINRPSKRLKTQGFTTGTDNHSIQTPLSNLQRCWTEPGPAQRAFPMPSNVSNSQAPGLSQQTPGANQRPQNARMTPVSSDDTSNHWAQQQQQHQQGSFTLQSNGTSLPNSWGQQQAQYSQLQPQIAHAQTQNYFSASPLNTSLHAPWILQQSPSDHTPMSVAGSSLQATTDVPAPPQNTQWSTQNLPTPAPSSVDSQIPSPATSNLNPQVDHYAHQTPSYTDSPGTRKGSSTSLQKGHQCPRAQQAELVANLFSAAAQTATPEQILPVEIIPVKETTEPEFEDDSDEISALNYPDVVFEQDLIVSNPAAPTLQPISSSMEETNADALASATNTSLATTSVSKYLQEGDEDFLKSIQESSEWISLKDDPIFAKIKANTTTVTFDQLVARRQQLMKTRLATPVDSDDDDDASSNNQSPETDEKRSAREQEERLAALGVTGQAKPVQNPATIALGAELSFPAEGVRTTRALGDPGWKIYERGRAVEHRSTSFESPPSTNKNSRSASSVDHSPAENSRGLKQPRGFSPDASTSTQQPHRKRTYSEPSDEVDSILRQQASERKYRKPPFKQPLVAAAYGRRW